MNNQSLTKEQYGKLFNEGMKDPAFRAQIDRQVKSAVVKHALFKVGIVAFAYGAMALVKAGSK